MNSDKIKDYLIEQELLVNPAVSILGQGEANIAYLAEDKDRKYVVRTARGDIAQESRLETEQHFMLFIASLGIAFAPRSIHYDPVPDLHVVSYVEGKDISAADLDSTQLAVFVDQLKLLDEITYDNYLAWCHQNEQTPRAPQTLATRNKNNIDDRLETLRNAADAQPFARGILGWAEPKVAILYEAQRTATLRTRFLHDDLRWNQDGGNIRAEGNKLTLIDWELSGFFEEAAPEIGDVLGSIPTASHAVATNLYQAYMQNEANAEQLNTSIRYGVLWGKLGNPLWAAERYIILSENNHPNAERYKQLVEQQIKDAQPFFDLPFSQWFQ